MNLLPEVIFIAIIAVYSYVITHKIPPAYYSFSNLIVATGTIIVGSSIGLQPDQFGLSPSTIVPGIIYGAALSLPLIVTVLLIATSKKFSKHFTTTPSSKYSPKNFANEFFFRIPFGTALSEEVIFRGVLLALLLENHSFALSVSVSSVIFGLWHIFPTLHTSKSNDPLIDMMDDQRKRNAISLIIAVGTTIIAGIGFSLLNARSNSLISSWIVHSSINGFAILGGYISVWYQHKKLHDVRIKL
jgi:membrane protease YdiL (CAAX protease family)